MSKLQVLVATMELCGFDLYHRMNLNSDTIFANQTNHCSYEEKTINNHCVKKVSTITKGVGKNRNIGLMYADADILLLSDDDVKYVDDYEKIIINAFEKCKKADVIIFNIKTVGNHIDRRVNDKIKRVHYYNGFNYGAVRIAFRRKSVIREGITFNENFGGGTIYSAGEDTLFIRELLKNGLIIYTYPTTIASVNQDTSSWFHGYTNKYFYDKGALFYALSSHLYYLLCLQDLIRHYGRYKKSSLSIITMIMEEIRGAKGYKKLTPYA